jgi:hypothetical protein
MACMRALVAMLRDFVRSVAAATERLREQLQREIDDERNPPHGRA